MDDKKYYNIQKIIILIISLYPYGGQLKSSLAVEVTLVLYKNLRIVI